LIPKLGSVAACEGLQDPREDQIKYSTGGRVEKFGNRWKYRK
jgi:hypothetical protein